MLGEIFTRNTIAQPVAPNSVLARLRGGQAIQPFDTEHYPGAMR